MFSRMRILTFSQKKKNKSVYGCSLYQNKVHKNIIVSIWNRWFNKYEINSHPPKKKNKYEINSLIYTLSFLVTPQKPTFISVSQTLSFFIMHFLTVFTKHSTFWNSTFLLCIFNKTPLFDYALLTKLHFLIMHFYKKLNHWDVF